MKQNTAKTALQNDNEYAVIVENLTKHFGNFVAVNNISFKIKKGEVFGFLGPNGAGKSTTIRMLCGLLMPSSGKGLVGGYDIATQPDEVKNRIGYMSQKFSLYEDLTVEENLDFFGGIYGLEDERLEERKRWALTMAGLEGKEKILTQTLSGGWKQRLALGCAVLHEPPILFLDEPTGGVDPVSRRNFWDLIYDLSNKGITIFVTTHYLDEAEHCNTIGLIYNGKIIALGSPTEHKHSLERYLVYEVRCSSPVEAMELLQKQPWTVETSIFGSLFHISTISHAEVEIRMRRILENANIKVEDIRRIIPSLEDVFIHLIAEEDAQYQKGM